MRNEEIRMKYTIVFVLLLFGVSFHLVASAPNAPFHLRCDDKVEPVGVSDTPYFAWFMSDPDNNEIQSAYQIIVSSSVAKLDSGLGDIWDSGKTMSRMQNYVCYKGITLNPASQYFWKVRIWDKEGNAGPYSEPASFSTGLFTNKDWAGAQWIKRDTQVDEDYTYYRKNITLPAKKIKRAVVYMSASHSYEFYINGHFAGKGSMHHYPRYSYYHAWDVTHFLSAGSGNLFACLTHWYGGGQGRAAGERGFLMKAIIEYTDSTSTILGTDNTWKQTQATQWVTGQPQRNGEGIGYIEKIDSRKMIKNWNMNVFDDSKWEFAAETGPQPTPPWTGILRSDLARVVEKEIKPVSVKQIEPSKYVIDLGKIYPGSFKINFEGGAPGDTVTMLGGFVLNSDGSVSEEINQKTNLDFYFILNGEKAQFNPAVYLGLQYLQVENSPNVLTRDNVSFLTRHYELTPDPPSFESSDAMLNNVWNLMVHSLYAGAQEGFLDTPTREKGTFLGDSWAQAVPCLSVLYDRTLNLRSLNEFLDSQNQYWPDGRLNAVYPNCDGARDIPDYTQQYLIWVWDYYMQTGNTAFLEKHYNQFKKVAEYVYAYRNDATGLIHNLKGGSGPYEFGIIDWPMGMRYGYDMDVESRTVIDAYAYEDFKIISEIAGVVGNSSDQDHYWAKADSIKAAMNSHLLNEEGVYIDGLYSDKSQSKHVSQHANILPYALDIAPKECRDKIVEAIKNRKMSVGMICLRWLPEALGKAGEGEHLIDLYTHTEWDGWAKNITQGATVTWECWNAIELNQSMSHPWGAAGLLGIQNYILGIQSLSPQNNEIQIKPLDFGKKLSYARGSYKTDKGEIFVDWKNENNHYRLSVTIPDNIAAKVYIPKGDADSAKITLDQKEIEGISEGDYVCFDHIGSGEHIFQR